MRALPVWRSVPKIATRARRSWSARSFWPERLQRPNRARTIWVDAPDPDSWRIDDASGPNLKRSPTCRLESERDPRPVRHDSRPDTRSLCRPRGSRVGLDPHAIIGVRADCSVDRERRCVVSHVLWSRIVGLGSRRQRRLAFGRCVRSRAHPSGERHSSQRKSLPDRIDERDLVRVQQRCHT